MFMHGHESTQADTTTQVIGHLLPEGSIFSFLRDHRRELFSEDDFADLFPSGLRRGSPPGSQMAAVMMLQALYAYSDRDTADAVVFDLRWKTACGFPLDYAGFHPSTLTYWRRRIAASTRPNRIFDTVADVITATGADVLIPVVCHRYLKLTGQDYTVTGKPAIAWDDPHAQEELISALVGDAHALLGALDVDAITTIGGPQADAVALLGLVAGQDVEPAEGSDGTDGRWRIARKVAPDRVMSTVDPESRHARKTRMHRQDGFKAHVIVEPDTGLATGVDMTKAAGGEGADHGVGARLVTGDPTLEVSREAGPVSILGDSPGVECHDLLLRRQRWFATVDWFQETYRRYRPMVERSLAWITRGVRRLRYRGVARNNAWLHTRIAGVNLRRLITLGLNRTDGMWMITA